MLCYSKHVDLLGRGKSGFKGNHKKDQFLNSHQNVIHIQPMVIHASSCASVCKTPSLYVLPVISSSCRHCVSRSLSPPLFNGFSPQTWLCQCIPMTLFINNELHVCVRTSLFVHAD